MPADYAWKNLFTAVNILVGAGPQKERLSRAHWEIGLVPTHLTDDEDRELRERIEKFLKAVDDLPGDTTEARISSMTGEECDKLAKECVSLFNAAVIADQQYQQRKHKAK